MIIYKIEFEHVSPIAHPEYYIAEHPAVLSSRVLNEHWEKAEREDTESAIRQQYKGLMQLIERGELIRNVIVWKAKVQEPKWIDVTPPNVMKTVDV